MAELHDRCRYWPLCRIHLGAQPPTTGRVLAAVDDNERREIRAKYRDGVTRDLLVEDYELSGDQIDRILHQHPRPGLTPPTPLMSSPDRGGMARPGL